MQNLEQLGCGHAHRQERRVQQEARRIGEG